MFGFSAGGFTALVTLGGDPDLTRVAEYCAVHPDEWACLKLKEFGGARREAPITFVHDARIAAAVIAAPAIGYSFTPESLAGVTAPIQLWRGDADEILPHPRHAQNVYESLPLSPTIMSCRTPATSPSWRPAPQWQSDMRRISAATQRASIVLHSTRIQSRIGRLPEDEAAGASVAGWNNFFVCY